MTGTTREAVEWAEVTPGTVVVATAQQAWLHRPGALDPDDPFALPMRGPGSVETTGQLLDCAIGAAQRAVQAPPRPPLTLARWVFRLAGYYHTTHATPPLMAEAAARFASAGRTALAAYAAEKVEDEGGHDTLALADLEALGLRAEALVEALVPPTAAALVKYFAECVRGDDPVRSVGYAYALERLASTMSRDYVLQVEALLPPRCRATRCLRVHSANGADIGHVQDAVTVACALSPEERTRVAQACYDTTRIMFSAPVEGQISEAALEASIAAFRNVPPVNPRSPQCR